MDALSAFRAAATAWLICEQLAPLNLRVSGVAELTDLAGDVTYSLSCIPPINSTFSASPNEVHKVAQRAPLPGYILTKTQTSRFETDLPIPDPRWRYQFTFRMG